MRQDEEKVMADLKKEYTDIPVPPQAKTRLLQGINQAKREQKRRTHMKLFKSTGATAAAAMVAITMMANLTPTTANAMEKIPVIGSIAKVVTFRTFEDQKEGYEAKVEIPQINIGGKAETAANQSIEEYANQLIAQYEQQLAEDQGQGHYTLDSSYRVVTDTDKYLSIRIDTTVAMASGAQYVKIFTVDKATGNVLTLNGLFSNNSDLLNAVSNNIKEQMDAQMDADENVTYFLNSDMPDTDFTGLKGTESFYFNKAGELVITFDEYEVAPGYMGAVEFTIPLSVTGRL